VRCLGLLKSANSWFESGLTRSLIRSPDFRGYSQRQAGRLRSPTSLHEGDAWLAGPSTMRASVNRASFSSRASRARTPHLTAMGCCIGLRNQDPCGSFGSRTEDCSATPETRGLVLGASSSKPELWARGNCRESAKLLRGQLAEHGEQFAYNGVVFGGDAPGGDSVDGPPVGDEGLVSGDVAAT
jgi:hypothetical protein